MTNKEKYIEFCKKEQVPIFSQYWWLDALCGEDNWDVLLYEKGEEIWASMPYYIESKYSFNILKMPKLTQTMGPYIKYPKGQKYYKKLSWEKELMNYFINSLPEFDYFLQKFNYEITNHLPFYWKGFNQSTNYTYVIEDTSDLDLVWGNFTSDTRKKINKAKKIVKVIEDNDIKKFYSMVKMTFDRQNLNVPYSYDYFIKLDNECSKRNSRKILFAIDEKNLIHVAIYIVWDKKSVYLLSSGGNPSLRNSGAKNLLVWRALEFANKNKLVFDFEGSMTENIEIYNRSFGAIQKPYFQISKTNSKLLKTVLFMRDLIK